MESEHQVPIWFFIGILLLIYGVVILGAGLYGLAYPSQVQIKLSEANPQASWFFLHPDIWWSVLLIALGTLYTVKFKPVSKQA